MSTTPNPVTLNSVSNDLIFAMEADGLWHGYGAIDRTDPERPFIPVEEYGPNGDVIASFKLWIEIEETSVE